MENHKCFCGIIITYDQMKKHYRVCTAFKNKFREIDTNISKSIKHFVDKISYPDKKEDYANELFLLKFLIKRYVNLVGDLIKKSSYENNYSLERARNNINENSSLNITSNKSVNQKQQLNIKGNYSSLDLEKQYTQPAFNAVKESSDEEFKLIHDYCEKVSKKTTNYDDNVIKVMSDSISALTSRDCFVMVNNDGNLIVSEDEDKIFYTININNNNFYVLLY